MSASSLPRRPPMFDANKLLNQMLGAGPAAPSKATSVDSPMDQIGGLFGSLCVGLGVGNEGRRGRDREADRHRREDRQRASRAPPASRRATLFEQVKAFAAQNTLATTAALGGLGALLVGTQGRARAARQRRGARRACPDRRPCLQGVPGLPGEGQACGPGTDRGAAGGQPVRRNRRCDRRTTTPPC